MAYTKYSLTPANNTATPPDGAPEGMLPSAVNDTMRDMMAQIRDCGDGIRDGTYTMTAPKITGGTITGSTINNSAIGGTTAAAGAFTTLSATGVTTVQAGSVSAPAITTSGDTNTGIFFPAADTIAFTEGGVESMRITSAGDVGIGTSSPTASRLHIAGYNGGTTYPIRMTSSNSGVEWAFETGGSAAGSSFLAFRDIGNSAERMRITAAGDVGIGQSSPVNIAGYTIQTINNATNGGGIYLQSNGTTIGRILNTATDFFVGGVSASSACVLQSGGAERMRIDSSGNVGIGTSSPARTIDIARSSSSGNSANFPALLVKNTLATQGDGSTTFNYARIDVQAGNGTVFADFGTRYDSYAGAFLGTETNHPIHFQTNGTERMRIDSSGNLLVGDTGSTVTSGKLRVLQTTTDSNYISRIQSSAASGMLGLSIYYSGASPNGTGNVFLVCEDTTTTRMAVRSNGGIANYSANDVNLSDVREKTNIELAGNYLDKICSIPVKTFNYIDQNREDDGGLTLGVIAQEVQAVAPELVMESNWAAKDQPEKMRLSIYQTDLQYALMKAIQELKAELDSVKAELQTLKGN